MRSESQSRGGRLIECAVAGIFYSGVAFVARYYGKPDDYVYYTAGGWFILLLSSVAAVAAVAFSSARARARAHMMQTKSDLLSRFKYLASLSVGWFILTILCVLLRRPLWELPRQIFLIAEVASFLMGVLCAAAAGGALFSYLRSGMERGSDSPAAWRELVGAPRLEEPEEPKELAEGGGEFAGENFGTGGNRRGEAGRDEAEAVPLQPEVPPAFDERGRSPLQRMFDES